MHSYKSMSVYFVFRDNTKKARLSKTAGMSLRTFIIKVLVFPPFIKNGGDTHINVPK